MQRIVWLAVLGGVGTAGASPSTIRADLSYGSGRFSAENVSLFVARLEAAHRHGPLRIGGSLSFARTSTTNEGETRTDTALSNPALRARYGFRLGAIELGVTTGLVLTVGEDLDYAKLVAGTFEAMRHPYEHSRTSAVPLVVDVVGAGAHWRGRAALGAYFINDGGLQLDEIHAAIGGAVGDGQLWLVAQLHALFAPPAATSPVQYEPMRRDYYGIELAIEYELGAMQRIRGGVWKPFGYDNSDAGDGMTSLTLGTTLGF